MIRNKSACGLEFSLVNRPDPGRKKMNRIRSRNDGRYIKCARKVKSTWMQSANERRITLSCATKRCSKRWCGYWRGTLPLTLPCDTLISRDRGIGLMVRAWALPGCQL